MSRQAIAEVDSSIEFFKLHHADILRLTGKHDPVTKELIVSARNCLEGMNASECVQCGHWFPNDDLATIVICAPPPDATEPCDSHYQDVLLCKECHENQVEEVEVR